MQTVLCREPAHRKHPEPLALFSSFKHRRPRLWESLPSGALGGGLSPSFRQQGDQGWQSSPRPLLLQTCSATGWVPWGVSSSERQLGLGMQMSKCESPVPTLLSTIKSSRVKINNLFLEWLNSSQVCSVIWRLWKHILITCHRSIPVTQNCISHKKIVRRAE